MLKSWLMKFVASRHQSFTIHAEQESKSYEVYACDVNTSGPIQKLRAHIVELDVTSSGSIAAFKGTVGSKPIDILFNVAGKREMLITKLRIVLD